jgi:hypothetical protein
MKLIFGIALLQSWFGSVWFPVSGSELFSLLRIAAQTLGNYFYSFVSGFVVLQLIINIAIKIRTECFLLQYIINL